MTTRLRWIVAGMWTGVSLLRGAPALEHADIGAPALAGDYQPGPGDSMRVRGAGIGVGPRTDQFHFAWKEEPGDFDLRVRVEAFDGRRALSGAGLMVRSSLESNAPLAAVVYTPASAGVLFQARDTPGGALRHTGAAFAQPPDCWLRLQRRGDTITGAISEDGRAWAALGTVTIVQTNALRVGLSVTSWEAGELAAARFSSWGPAEGTLSPAATPRQELPGPTSRRSGLVISEIMYHPADRPDGRDLEFIEVFNSQSVFEDLSGYRLSGALDFVFPTGTVLPGGGYLVVARVPEDVRATYGLDPVVGGYPNRLDNGEGIIRLRNRIDAVLQEVHYRDTPPWPASADGAGHSLVLVRPSLGEGSPAAWGPSARRGGSPGRWDGAAPAPLDRVLINEVLTHTDPPDLDFIELLNPTDQAIELGGAYLSDRPDTNRFRIPEPTTLPPFGRHAFTQLDLGFALDAAGETVYFVAPDNSRVIDAIRFPAQAPGTAYGRSPDGSSHWRSLAAPTAGERNASPRRGPVVINELLYHPVSGDETGEFIELLNLGPGGVDLTGWRFVDGIDYEFPAGAQIASGGYLVVARDATGLRSHHPHLTPANCLGNFQGSLDNGGEWVRLARPEPIVSTNAASELETNIVFVVEAEVAYSDGGRWGRWADGGGSSLELVDPRSDPACAANWADSDESGKAGWTLVQVTDVLEQGNATYGINQLQLFLEGEGECVVDDVEVIGPGGTNQLTNGDFETGLTSWAVQGGYRRSAVEPGVGRGGGAALVVRADSRGDPGANRVRGTITGRLVQGDTVTLRAWVRWLRGDPEFLMRLRGNYLEAFARLDTSAQLGSPGAPNSRARANAGPAVQDVRHDPVLPAADQAVVVSALVRDPDGLQSLELVYRLDPATNLFTVPMRDDGLEGDTVPGDGRYAALLPGQPVNTLAAFHLRATDAAAPAAVSLFPSDAPARECLIRFGEPQPGGSFGVYRIWMTQATRSRWTSREKLDNTPLDVTFVSGNQRVIYNAGALYAGSPFISPGYTGPTGALCGYVVRFPKDDRFLGITDMNLDWPTRDSTLQLEQVAYWIADQLGLPRNHRRFVHLYVNGIKRGVIYEDTQQPNADVVAQYFPDDADGDLYKIEDWFEFDNSATSFSNRDATLERFRRGNGEPNVARYRWNWRKRAVQGSPNDYRTLTALAEAVNVPDFDAYTRAVESVVDLREWLGIIAVEHLVGNWDSFGYGRGKNMYAYHGPQGGWRLLMWDIDFVLGASSDPPEAWLAGTIDPAISRMFYHPPFQRRYYGMLRRATEGPLKPEAFWPVLSGHYNALLANGVAAVSPRSGSNYLTARLNHILEETQFYQAPFTITNPTNGATVAFNTVLLTGTAPLTATEIRVNGVAYPVRWVSATDWQLSVPVTPGANTLDVVLIGDDGQPLANGTRSWSVQYTGAAASPADHLVFSEILHHPEVPGSEFVELLNTSSTHSLDLGGLRLDGLDFDFPAGTLLDPGGYLVLTHDRTAFIEAYGTDPIPAGQFAGTLSPEGETLRLIHRGANPTLDTVLREVTFATMPPWPAAANQGGVSLQIEDPSHSQNRLGNWSVRLPEPPAEWVRYSTTGVAGTNRLLLYFGSLPPIRDLTTLEGGWTGDISAGGTHIPIGFEFRPLPGGDWTGDLVVPSDGFEQRFALEGVHYSPPTLFIDLFGSPSIFRFTNSADGLTFAGVYQPPGEPAYPTVVERSRPGGELQLDDVSLVAGETPEVGPNLVQNGGFESDGWSPWTLAPNLNASSVASGIAHTGTASALVSAKVGGFDDAGALVQDLTGLTPGQTYTLSYWIRQGATAPGFIVRLADWSLVDSRSHGTTDARPVTATPGRANANARSTPPLPPLWINELQPVNAGGLADGAGEREPWVELYNAGTTPLSLDGWSLSASPEDLRQWRFPTHAVVPPGGFVLVWLDAEPGESTDTDWHASIRPDPTAGLLILARPLPEGPQIVDYLNYAGVPLDQSIGWAVDGQPARRQVMATPTPRLPNATVVPTTVVLNEWMASNDGTLADPADGDFEDWFELYNPAQVAVSLGGYLLSDATGNPGKFVVPAGTMIPPRGFLLVWADNEPEQTTPGGAVHTNFKLDADADVLLLSAPDGTRLDAVSFADQSADVTEGRWPDGAAPPLRALTVPSPGAANAWWPAVRFQTAGLEADGTLALEWPSAPGLRYRVLATDVLTGRPWVPIGGELLATGPSVRVRLEPPAPAAQRFYRLELVR